MEGPLKWHGGKHYMAPKIVALMPPHVHYVEPYFGGGSVLLAKDPEGVSEVVNDLHRDLLNFWRVLQHDALFPEFLRVSQATPFAEPEWDRAREGLGEYTATVGRAWAFFVFCRQSRAGRMKSFAPLSRNRTRRGMNEQASAWLNAVEGLPAVHERLKRVVILGPAVALKVIEQQDGPSTLFYLDPPYPADTRTAPNVYQHETDWQHHLNLLFTLSEIRGKFLLSGYRNEHYDRCAQKCGWNRHDFDLPNNAAGGGEKRRMTECVWCNY